MLPTQGPPTLAGMEERDPMVEELRAPVLLVTERRTMKLRDRVRATRDLLRHHLLQQGKDAPEFVKLPTEQSLAVEYSTGRNVVRHALAALQQEGLISRTQGSGTALRRIKIRTVHLKLRGLALGLAHGGEQISYETQRIEFRPAPAPVAEIFGIVVGTRIAVFERRCYYKGNTLSLNSRYLLAGIAENLLANDETETNDWYGALERAAGTKIAGARTITEALAADEWLAPDLVIPIGSPIFMVHRTVYDVEGGALEFDLTRSRGDLIEMETWTPR